MSIWCKGLKRTSFRSTVFGMSTSQWSHLPTGMIIHGEDSAGSWKQKHFDNSSRTKPNLVLELIAKYRKVPCPTKIVSFPPVLVAARPIFFQCNRSTRHPISSGIQGSVCTETLGHAIESPNDRLTALNHWKIAHGLVLETELTFMYVELY